MIYTYAENGEFYIRVETDDNIEYIFFNNNYEQAVEYCNKKNININAIKKWKTYNFNGDE